MELTVPIKVEIDKEKLQFLYDEGYKQGRADAIEEIYDKVSNTEYCDGCEHRENRCAYSCNENGYSEFAILDMLARLKEQSNE